MGVMQTVTPAGAIESLPLQEDALRVPAGVDIETIEAARKHGTPLRDWPKAAANLYREEITRRIYREQHFLFLVGLLTCLATIVIDILVNPAMVMEGAVLRILAVAPLTMVGLLAGARGWTSVLKFCVGASPIAFIAVVVQLGFMLPPELASRYLNATILLIGLANVMLPYSLRGLVVFDCAALLVTAGIIAVNAPQGIGAHIDQITVFALVAAATLPIAARFERLLQNNFLLTLRARIFGRELLEANRNLRSLSETDPLTGIPNRRWFELQFDARILAPGEKGRGTDSIGLLLIDLDHFKAFNDSHGHQAGDYCLTLVAEALRDVIESKGGIAARYGGEEFVGAVRVTDKSTIVELAEDVRGAIADVLAPADKRRSPMVTTSVGVGIAPAAAKLPREELIEMADAALYAAKDRGRNRVEVVEAEAAFNIGSELRR